MWELPITNYEGPNKTLLIVSIYSVIYWLPFAKVSKGQIYSYTKIFGCPGRGPDEGMGGSTASTNPCWTVDPRYFEGGILYAGCQSWVIPQSDSSGVQVHSVASPYHFLK
jgi:hypothetical protein